MELWAASAQRVELDLKKNYWNLKKEVNIKISLNIGDGFGQAWGSDLTEEYVVFNSAYTT